jgi:anti-sigma factor RsiW
MKEVSEQDLHAYVDGRLDEARRREVEACLADDPAAAEKVAAWHRQNVSLHALFDPALDEPLPPRLRRLWRAPPAALRYAAMVGWLAVGLALGWIVRGPAGAPVNLASLPRQAAIAHVVYSAEVLHPVEVGADQEAHLVKWLSKRLGNDVRAPDLGAAGFQLVGGRLLPGATGPAAQFMYQDAQGQRLTLYVRTHAPDARETAFRYEKDDGVGVFYWVDGPLGYALSGELDRARLLEVAKLVYHQLAS